MVEDKSSGEVRQLTRQLISDHLLGSAFIQEGLALPSEVVRVSIHDLLRLAAANARIGNDAQVRLNINQILGLVDELIRCVGEERVSAGCPRSHMPDETEDLTRPRTCDELLPLHNAAQHGIEREVDIAHIVGTQWPTVEFDVEWAGTHIAITWTDGPRTHDVTAVVQPHTHRQVSARRRLGPAGRAITLQIVRAMSPTTRLTICGIVRWRTVLDFDDALMYQDVLNTTQTPVTVADVFDEWFARLSLA